MPLTATEFSAALRTLSVTDVDGNSVSFTSREASGTAEGIAQAAGLNPPHRAGTLADVLDHFRGIEVTASPDGGKTKVIGRILGVDAPKKADDPYTLNLASPQNGLTAVQLLPLVTVAPTNGEVASQMQAAVERMAAANSVAKRRLVLTFDDKQKADKLVIRYSQYLPPWQAQYRFSLPEDLPATEGKADLQALVSVQNTTPLPWPADASLALTAAAQAPEEAAVFNLSGKAPIPAQQSVTLTAPDKVGDVTYSGPAYTVNQDGPYPSLSASIQPKAAHNPASISVFRSKDGSKIADLAPSSSGAPWGKAVAIPYRLVEIQAKQAPQPAAKASLADGILKYSISSRRTQFAIANRSDKVVTVIVQPQNGWPFLAGQDGSPTNVQVGPVTDKQAPVTIAAKKSGTFILIDTSASPTEVQATLLGQSDDQLKSLADLVPQKKRALADILTKRADTARKLNELSAERQLLLDRVAAVAARQPVSSFTGEIVPESALQTCKDEELVADLLRRLDTLASEAAKAKAELEAFTRQQR